MGTTIKYKPILFSAPMVRAILSGRKTQTRRVVKPFPCAEGWSKWNQLPSDKQRLCPYGQPGMRLWVRETWGIAPSNDADYKVSILAHKRTDFIVYRAGGELIGTGMDDSPLFHDEQKWESPIFMPRWASRITLEVTGVRVERLQDISEEDAEAEGIITDPKQWDACYTDAYIRLWQSINGPGSWNLNPFVWVIKFKKI